MLVIRCRLRIGYDVFFTISKSKLWNSGVHRSIASVGVIESDIKCVHSSGAGEGRDPGPGDKTLPLESRLRYTSGGHYIGYFYSVSQWRFSGENEG